MDAFLGLVGVLIGGLIVFAGQFVALSHARQENRDSWRRQAMTGATQGLLQSSFDMTAPASRAWRERLAGTPLVETQPHLDNSHAAHERMTENITTLRLLAPTPVVTAAEKLHDACHELINFAMGSVGPGEDPTRSQEAWQKVRDGVTRARQALIRAVRDTYGIESPALEISALAASSWTVPTDGPRVALPEAGQVSGNSVDS